MSIDVDSHASGEVLQALPAPHAIPGGPKIVRDRSTVSRLRVFTML
jgi:hypothetical protein